LKYRELKDYKYLLCEDLTYPIDIKTQIKTPFIEIHGGFILIKANYAWDGATGPAIDTSNFMKGSLIHDALYQLMREKYIGLEHRKYADCLLREICLMEGMSKFRAWYVYHAVRWFGRFTLNDKHYPKHKIIEI
jgi:hypothetical protein